MAYIPSFPFRTQVDLDSPPVLGAQIPPSTSFLASVDASGFHYPVFQYAGTGGLTGVASLNGATGNVIVSGSGFSVSNVAQAFTVANTGVLSVAAGTGGVTVGGTATAPTISSTTSALVQNIGVSLGAFTGAPFSAGGFNDSIFTSALLNTLSAGTYLITFSWKIPYACFSATSATFSYAELWKNGAPTGELFKSTLIGGLATTPGGLDPSFQQTVTGIIVVAPGDAFRYIVDMTNSVYVNPTGSTISYSAVQIA